MANKFDARIVLFERTEEHKTDSSEGLGSTLVRLTPIAIGPLVANEYLKTVDVGCYKLSPGIVFGDATEEDIRSGDIQGF